MRFQSDDASIAPSPALSADALTSAATLIHAPDALYLCTSTGVGQTVPAACSWADGALLALLPNGPLATAIRLAGPAGLAVSARAERVTLDTDGWPQQSGRLECHGTTRAVPGWFRGHAALIMCYTHLHSGVVAAVTDDDWLLVEVNVARATWTSADGVIDLAPHALCTRGPEESAA
jgi:hypothetical protein